MALLFGILCGFVILVLFRYMLSIMASLTSLQPGSTQTSEQSFRDVIQGLLDKARRRSRHGVSESNTVVLPDLFVSWAKIPLAMNPRYNVVGPEAESWFNNACNRDDRESRKWAKAKIPCFASLWLPDAPADEFRTVIDFLNWIWAWDDKIDEGVLDKKPDLIKLEIDYVLAILSESPEQNPTPEHPINHVLHSIWQRIVQKASKGVQNRFRAAMQEYMDQVLEQAHLESLEMSKDMDSFLINHRGSSGAKIIVHMSEYANGLDIPDFVFEDPAIQRIRDLQPEHFLLSNDIYSYARESKFGHHHNIVHILRTQGMTQQEAFNYIAEAIVARYKEWDEMVAQVPRWGDAIDAQVQKYIEATRLTIVAHLEWSFVTERYFGTDGELARKTRRVPATPMY